MRAIHLAAVLGIAASAAACNYDKEDEIREYFEQAESELVLSFGGNRHAHSLHLEENLRFRTALPGSDADLGRRLFGLAEDLDTSDDTEALFEGYSQAYGPIGFPVGDVVVSNGRTCFSCHRGVSLSLGMPPPPISDTVELTDPLFTGIEADAQGDPDAMNNLDQLGLFKYRPNRFNPALPQSDPYRQVFFWRKSQPLMNMVFSRGFLNDGRGRVVFEAARGAVFSHTQETDFRFDDLLLNPIEQNAWEAFLFEQVTDDALLPLLDPDHPDHDRLARRPFATVDIQTRRQRRGKRVFKRDCMGCHNTPNVFNNISNIVAHGPNPFRPNQFIAFGPNIGRGFNIGVSERNKHDLRHTHFNGDGTFSPITLQLVDEDGDTRQHTVTFDIGMAATTGRTGDLGKFKVPQLRNIANIGPYFHDNSAATLEEVIEYFNSAAYNHSKDGRRFRIHQTQREKRDLLEFLKIL